MQSAPSHNLIEMEIEVLRILNGEDVPGWVAGAAMNACAETLRNRGYASFGYTITDKGVALLKELGYV